MQTIIEQSNNAVKQIVTDDGYQNLADAIIKSAVLDYKRSDAALNRNPDDWGAEQLHEECLLFFHSNLFELCSDYDPDYFLSILDRCIQNKRGKRNRAK